MNEFYRILMLEIGKAASIGMTTHAYPDGDGLCVCLALKRILARQGRVSDIIMDNLDLHRYDFLQALEHVRTDSPELRYDLLLVIDVHDRVRLNRRYHLLESARTVIVLDHHEVDDDLIECTHHWIDSSAVCTGWMLHALFGPEIENLGKEDRLYIGNCLYASLLNDTNNFINANTGLQAFDLALAVCRHGVSPADVYKVFMNERTPVEKRLEGQILATLEQVDNGRIVFMHSTLEMLRVNGLGPEATSNLTRLIQDLKGVETAVFFREEHPLRYRLSLRSKTIDVHHIAVRNGGGGHKEAAGCHLDGTLEAVKSMILQELQAAPGL